MRVALELFVVAALIAANAFFVIAEYAVVTARRSALQPRAEAGSKGAVTALRLMDDPVRVISAVQVAISALGILLGAIGEPVVSGLLGDVVPSWVSVFFGFLVVTYLSVAFGELVPKALALSAAERIVVLVSRPIDLFSRLCSPLVWALQLSSKLVLRPLGVSAVSAGERAISREELRGVLQEAEQHGELGADEEDMLSGVIDLRIRQVQDVMRPWDDVAVVHLDEPSGATLDRMLASAHSRFPALGTAGEVVGVLHARDAWAASRAATDDDGELGLRSLLRAPVIVPPNTRVDVLLRRLRRERQQLAIVIDEYGRPVGIATLEDVLEEIVGEIEDEFDELDSRFERIGDDEWLVDGAVSVSDLNRRLGTRLDAGRVRSIGGVLYDHFGRVPAVGEELELAGLALRVEALDGHRIAAVRAFVRRGDAPSAPTVVDPA
jgi:putative hemolysin